MVTWRNIAEWFDVNGEKLTLAVGGVGVGFSLACIQWGLPFDWAWLAIVAGYTSSYDAPMMGISDVSIMPEKGLTATVGGEAAEFASSIHFEVTPNMNQAIADNDVRINYM